MDGDRVITNTRKYYYQRRLKILNFFSILFIFRLNISESARILAIFPTPSISHQIAFRPIIQELIKRGHAVTVITTDPEFSKRNAPVNLTEVDIHEISYNYQELNPLRRKVKVAFEMFSFIFEKQLLSDEVQKIIRKKDIFDLLLIEMCVRPALVFSYIFKAPVILISSLGGSSDILESVGAATHLLLYPSSLRSKAHNPSLWDKITLYIEYNRQRNYEDLEMWEDKMLQRVLGTDVPPLRELRKNIDLLFLNTYWIWDSHRPVPPNVIYLGGLHLKPKEELLPKDLQVRLNSSVGAIFMSFGTNVDPSTLPPEKIRIFTRVLSRLPHTVLWKWNKEKLQSQSENIVVSKWFPQRDLLRHPKMKLFITQGGLQSTDEAIDAGIPLLGIPMIGDQWYNTEKYEHFKIGLKLEFETLTEEKLQKAIETLIKDTSYRSNIIKLREIVNDQPQTSLERAVWWTEYTLRHGGGKHLRTTAANLSWIEYYVVDLLISVFLYLLISGIVVYFFVK